MTPDTRLVPVEPTEEMLKAGMTEFADGTHIETLAIYRAMLAAARALPAAEARLCNVCNGFVPTWEALTAAPSERQEPTREEIARALYEHDEVNGPIRLNLRFEQLPSFRQRGFLRRADAILTLWGWREPSPDEARHLLASVIYDSRNTARLQEHPEELDEYLRQADGLIRHMRGVGLALVRGGSR